MCWTDSILLLQRNLIFNKLAKTYTFFESELLKLLFPLVENTMILKWNEFMCQNGS